MLHGAGRIDRSEQRAVVEQPLLQEMGVRLPAAADVRDWVRGDVRDRVNNTCMLRGNVVNTEERQSER